MPDGTEARLSRAERDIENLYHRVTVNAEKLAALPFMGKDLDELQQSFDRVAKSCENSERQMAKASEGLRQYVEDRLKADAEKARQDETEKRRLSVTQWGFILGAVAVVIAAIISAIASLAAAGAI